MKKLISCGLFLILLGGCVPTGGISAQTQNLNYIQKDIRYRYIPDINECSGAIIKKYVTGLGDVKLSYINSARDVKPFQSPRDLETRMEGHLSDNMIIQIEENFTF